MAAQKESIAEVTSGKSYMGRLAMLMALPAGFVPA